MLDGTMAGMRSVIAAIQRLAGTVTTAKVSSAAPCNSPSVPDPAMPAACRHPADDVLLGFRRCYFLAFVKVFNNHEPPPNAERRSRKVRIRSSMDSAAGMK